MPQLQLEIASKLDKITSTCFGLTCKPLYHAHISIHGTTNVHHTEIFKKTTKVRHGPIIRVVRETEVPAELHLFLRAWMWDSARLVWGGDLGLK